MFSFLPQIVISIYTGDSGQTDRQREEWQPTNVWATVRALDQKQWQAAVWLNVKADGCFIITVIIGGYTVVCRCETKILGRVFFFLFSNPEKFMLLCLPANAEQDEKSAGCLFSVWIKWQPQREKYKAASVSFLHYWANCTRELNFLTRCPPQMNFREPRVEKVFMSTCTRTWSHICKSGIHFKLDFWTKQKGSHGSFCIFSHCISAETVKLAYDTSPFCFLYYISELCEAETVFFWSKKWKVGRTGHKLHNTWKKRSNTTHEAFIIFLHI